MFLFVTGRTWYNVYANDIDAFIPELWANESLAILSENMIAAGMIHRDFENELARYGDLVHTRRPGEFSAKRKTVNDDVTVQDATSVDVQVKLDQHVHVSFMIRDGEESYAFKDLVATYLKPAMLAQTRFIDRIILGQYPQFMANAYGSLGGLSGSNVIDRILGVRGIMNINKAYVENRKLIWTPSSETIALSNELFISANKVGDQGQAMQEAFLGRKFGFDNYMCQNMADIGTGSATSAGTISNSGGYAKGATAINLGTVTGIISNNTWLKIAGDDTPQRVVSHAETLGNTTSVVLSPGLRASVANAAVVTFYTPGTVNNAGGYPAGYAKYLTIAGFTIAPKIGQMVTFGITSTNTVYTVMDATTTTLLLDRPLDVLVADTDKVSLGPTGSFNLAFHHDAIALVVRPLAPVRPGTGALSSTVNANNLSIRATISYDGMKQGHLVTLDMLCGIKVLDPNLGAVLLG